jgi:formylmethanofuran dehydrogenase subunit E
MSAYRPVARVASSGGQVRVAAVCSVCHEQTTVAYQEPAPQGPIVCDDCQREHDRRVVARRGSEDGEDLA